MNNRIRMIDNCFHKVTGYDKENGEEITEAISNFQFEILKRIYNEETEETEDLILITSKFKHIKTVREVIELKNLSNTKKFKESLSKKYSCFNFVGNDYDLEMIKELINKKKFQEVKGTNVIGINELNNEKYFVNKDTCFDSNFVNSDSYILSKKNTINLKNTFSDDFLTNEDCKKLESKIFNFNIQEITFPFISLTAGFFLNPILDKHNVKMPPLCCLGEPGSAKSETKDHICKNILHGFNDEIAADIKPFGAYKNLSETNIIPYSIEEYKIWTMPKHKQEFVRTIVRSGYDKHVTTKGHADQSITRYKINAPIIITGESMFEEKAGKERSMILQFAKQYHTKDRFKNFMYLKRNKKLLNKLGNNLLHESMNIDEEKLIENYYLLVDEITSKIQIPDRIINNIAVTCLGYNIVSKIFKENGIELPSTNTALKYIIKSQLDFNLEGNQENQGLIEQTIETFGAMISNNFLPQEIHNYFLFEDDLVYISLKNIFPEFTRYLKQYDVKGEFETRKNPFESLLSKSKYFIGKKRKNNKRYIVLDMKKIQDSDIDFDKPEETCEIEETEIPVYQNVYEIPTDKSNLVTLTSGDIEGNNVITKKYNLETKNISEVVGRIFFENKKVVCPEFENPKVYSQILNNMKNLFNIGDDYFKKVLENKQLKL